MRYHHADVTSSGWWVKEVQELIDSSRPDPPKSMGSQAADQLLGSSATTEQPLTAAMGGRAPLVPWPVRRGLESGNDDQTPQTQSWSRRRGHATHLKRNVSRIH